MSWNDTCLGIKGKKGRREWKPGENKLNAAAKSDGGRRRGGPLERETRQW